jgi:hypothetical protein
MRVLPISFRLSLGTVIVLSQAAQAIRLRLTNSLRFTWPKSASFIEQLVHRKGILAVPVVSFAIDIFNRAKRQVFDTPARRKGCRLPHGINGGPKSAARNSVCVASTFSSDRYIRRRKS